MTRGQHFHNTKNEKFYLIRGKILWRKKNLLSGKIVSKVIDDKKFVEFISIPGWWHEIKNLGREKAIILVWANEIFNINKSDTYKL